MCLMVSAQGKVWSRSLGQRWATYSISECNRRPTGMKLTELEELQWTWRIPSRHTGRLPAAAGAARSTTHTHQGMDLLQFSWVWDNPSGFRIHGFRLQGWILSRIGVRGLADSSFGLENSPDPNPLHCYPLRNFFERRKKTFAGFLLDELSIVELFRNYNDTKK